MPAHHLVHACDALILDSLQIGGSDSFDINELVDGCERTQVDHKWRSDNIDVLD